MKRWSLLAAVALAGLLGSGLLPVLHEHEERGADRDVCALCRISHEKVQAVPGITPRPEPPVPTSMVFAEAPAAGAGHRMVPSRGSRDPPSDV